MDHLGCLPVLAWNLAPVAARRDKPVADDELAEPLAFLPLSHAGRVNSGSSAAMMSA